MLSPETLNLEEIQDNINEIPQSCELLWMPIFKTSETLKGDNWVDANSSSVNGINWHPCQPNGGAYEKMCAVADELFEYWDLDCKQENCFYCTVEDFKPFRLKGLCQSDSEVLDHKFVFRSKALVNGRPTWKGYKRNIIQWNEVTKDWEMVDQRNDVLVATLKGSKELPVGENVWNLQTDDVCKAMGKGSKLTMMLSLCKEFEFSCSDGSCIHIDLKCNYVADCFDNSDENECSTLNLEGMEKYDVGILDIFTNEEKKIIKNPINISIDIHNIESIEEVNMRFTADFTVTAEWIVGTILTKTFI